MAVSRELSLTPPPCVVNPEKFCTTPCPLAESNRNAQLQAMQFFNVSAREHQRQMILDRKNPADNMAIIQELGKMGITQMCRSSDHPLPQIPSKEIYM